MKRTARIVAGWIAVVMSLSAGTTVAGPPGGTTEILIGATSVAQADPPDARSGDKRQAAGDLLRRAREAMAADDLKTAESLISAAEALDVRYGVLHLGDTPKKARRDLQRKRNAANKAPTRPSQLFSQLSLRKKTPRTDPFAGRFGDSLTAKLTDKRSLAQSYLLKGRKELLQGNLPAASHWYRMANKQQAAFGPEEDSPAELAAGIRKAGGNVDAPAAAADLSNPHRVTRLPQLSSANPVRPHTLSESSASQSPFGRAISTMPPGKNETLLPPALARANAIGRTANNTDAGTKNSESLLMARRALASGNVQRATSLVNQAKWEQVSYGPLDDTPEKVEAAIRKYQDVTAQPINTETDRRRRARMLMEQGEALLRYADYGLAEELAKRASQQKLTYGPFEANPEDLLRRIAAARSRSATASAPPSTTAKSPDQTGWSMAAKRKAVELIRQARAALAAGQLSLAERLARQAEQVGVPDSAYALGEDCPGLVLFDIRKATVRNQSGLIAASGQSVSPATGRAPVDQTSSRALYDSLNDPTRDVRAAYLQPGSSPIPRQLDFAQEAPAPTPVRPPPPVPGSAGPNANHGLSLFQQGEAALKAHDAERAYQYFRQAAAYMDQLDGITRQRLQERLQLLSVPNKHGDYGGPAESMVDETARKQRVLALQISADVAHQEAKARAMRQSDPKAALDLLEEARKTVEAAGLEPAARNQLLRRVDRHLADTRQFIDQNRPRIELEEKNERTREEIEREQRLKLEIQEKLALMVDDFNKKVDEQRFAEAQVVAKRAAELAPDNPVVQQLLHESRTMFRFYNNLAMQARKEEGFWAQLNNVDKASEGFDDYIPYRFPDVKDWSELSNFRSRFLDERHRQRSEQELEIERKLKTPVSVQFQDKPLSEVLDSLAILTGVNLHLDPQGLAEEGITSDTPVTIEVRHEIMLKSALNLILEPLHLGYVIKDEVLKITSEQLREGEVYLVNYPVADLVMPIPNFVPVDMGLASAYRKALSNVGFGGSNPYGFATPPLAVMASKDGNPNAATINPALLAQVSGAGPGVGGVGNMPAGFGPGGLGGGSQADFDSLIELITTTIQPTTWEEVGGVGSIAPFEGNLSIVVSQTQEVHEEIVDLLEQLRRLQDLQVTVEVRFVTLNDNFFERIGVDFDFDIDDSIDRPFQIFGRADPTISTTYSAGPFTANTGVPRDVLDRDGTRGVTVGLEAPGVFSADLDIPFTQNSFGLAVPQFGGFDATAGAQLGFAILSDIEAFFFINAAQGDRRSNVLQAPKVTLFNGQMALVSDTSSSPFVMGVIPVVGDFAAAQQPVIVVLSEGTFLTVQAVVSSDRRFVRLTVVPFFSKIGEVNTFQFTGSETTTTDTSAEGIQDEPDANTKSSNSSTVTKEGTTVQLPTYSQVTVSTTVSVPDGGTVLLGGIKRLSEGRNEFGVPMLNKLPYINRLFKNVAIGRETQSLMMMVTPRIIIQEEEELAQTGYSPR